MKVKTYREWLSSHLKDLGLRQAADDVDIFLRDKNLGKCPVSEEIAYREIVNTSFAGTAEAIEFKPRDGFGNMDVFVCLPSKEGGIRKTRLPRALRRLYLTEADAEKAGKEQRGSFDAVAWDVGTASLPVDYIDSDFDEDVLDCDIFLPGLFALTYEGFPDEKVDELVPDSLLNLGVIPVEMDMAERNGQIWVGYPGNFAEEDIFIVSLTLALRKYGAINPLDLPRIAQICSSQRKRDEMETIILTAFAHEYGAATGIEKEKKESKEEKERQKELAKTIKISDDTDATKKEDKKVVVGV